MKKTLIASAILAASMSSMAFADITICTGSISKYDARLAGLKIIDVEDDHDFNDATDNKGNRLYEFAKIPMKTYPNNLQTGFGSGVDTLSMQAVLVVNVDAMEEEEYESLLESYAMNLSLIQKQ